MGNHEAAESSKSTGKPGFRLSRAPVTAGGPLPTPELPDYEDLGALPSSYGEPVLYLVARDPEWFFAYWDLPHLEQTAMGGLTLKIRTAEGEVLETVAVGAEARNWYLPIPEHAAGSCFYGEIGFENEGIGWRVVTRSNRTRVPARGLAGSEGGEFATVPFHLAFQKLLEMVRPEDAQAGAPPEEPLVAALSRLQGEGRKLAAALGLMPDWSDEQRRVLSVLLGVGSEGMTDDRLREELEERLSSGGASDWSSSAWLTGALETIAIPGESSLMSWARGFSGSISGETLTSWLLSWERAGGGALLSSEWLSSWPGRLEAGAEGGLHSGLLSSWGGGVSSGVSSGEWGSSWSAQPFGVPRERNFFLHVNAEVIFYGGTHPEATVWINDEEVRLQPDGTFRHHFRFPDGVGSVPVVARSPDGVEHRGVLLRFDRQSGYTGECEATPQPMEIPDPLWQRGKERGAALHG